MKLIICCASILLMISCANSSKKIFPGADSLVISFQATTAAGATEVTTADKDAIKKVKQFMTGEEKRIYNCEEEGEVLFFREGKPAGTASFNIASENCRHFLWHKNGRLVATEMSNEAFDFLQSLKTGKTWY